MPRPAKVAVRQNSNTVVEREKRELIVLTTLRQHKVIVGPGPGLFFTPATPEDIDRARQMAKDDPVLEQKLQHLGLL